MTDATEDAVQQEFEYASEADVPHKEKFATTRKAGYVEDEVDVWVDKTIATSTEFLNRYNSAVYAFNLLKSQFNENVNSAVTEALAPALAEQRKELEVEFDNHYKTLEEDFARKSEELHASYEAAIAEAVTNANAQAQAAYVAPVVAEPTPEPVAAPEPVVEAVAPTRVVVDASSASRHAQEILQAAASEASEHVTRALEKVAAIEAEAEQEAAEIIDSANAEALEVRTRAFAEANEAIELKNKTLAERNEIFSRLKMFHTAQEEAINSEVESVGYTPLLTLEGFNHEAPVAEPVEEPVSAAEPSAYSYVEEEAPVVSHEESYTVASEEQVVSPDATPVVDEYYTAQEEPEIPAPYENNYATSDESLVDTNEDASDAEVPVLPEETSSYGFTVNEETSEEDSRDK